MLGESYAASQRPSSLARRTSAWPGRPHPAVLGQPLGPPAVDLRPLRPRAARRVALAVGRPVALAPLAVDPAEAQTRLDRLYRGDARDARPHLGDADPQSRRVAWCSSSHASNSACDAKAYSGRSSAMQPAYAAAPWRGSSCAAAPAAPRARRSRGRRGARAASPARRTARGRSAARSAPRNAGDSGRGRAGVPARGAASSRAARLRAAARGAPPTATARRRRRARAPRPPRRRRSSRRRTAAARSGAQRRRSSAGSRCAARRSASRATSTPTGTAPASRRAVENSPAPQPRSRTRAPRGTCASSHARRASKRSGTAPRGTCSQIASARSLMWRGAGTAASPSRRSAPRAARGPRS